MIKISYMRNSLSLLILLLALICTSCSSDRFSVVTFPSGRSVTCEVADNQKSQVAGLSTYDSLPSDRGMLFVYPQERTGLSFWMPARMNFSIDMIFVGTDKSIVYIIRNAPICESDIAADCPSYGPPSGIKARYVVEVVAGFCDEEGVTVGDSLEFTLP